VSFNCPLCGERHRCGQYISMEAEDQEEYALRLRENLERGEYLATLIFQSMTFQHQQTPGFRQLMQEAQDRGIPEDHVFEAEVVMTDEELYTCDACGRTFETAPMQRAHARRCEEGNRGTANDALTPTARPLP
jgi:predicted SprT family Zn-dependent metalloprotease